MLIDIIKERVDVINYSEKPVPDEDIKYILSAGCFAQPDAKEDSWLFGVVDDKNIIGELLKCCHGYKWIMKAPVLVALCTKRMSDKDLEVEKYRLGKLKEEIYDIDPNVLDILCAKEHSALIAAENMMNAAWEKGIGSCIISCFDVYKASKILKVPNSHLVTYLIAFGYFENKEEVNKTIELNNLVFKNQYHK